MKIVRLSITLAAAVILAAACACTNKDNPSGHEGEQQEQEQGGGSETGPDTYKFVASALKGKWEAGDVIYVHGNMGSWSETITLSAADISSDGKTATGKLGEVTSKPAEPDGLYAAWPYEAVKDVKKKIGSKTSFEKCDGLLTVAYLSGDTFNFIDVASSLTFKVTGDYDSYALCAGDRDGMEVTDFCVDYTSKGMEIEQRENTGYPFKYGSVKSGETVKIWLPGGMSFAGGLYLYFGKGDSWSAVYSIAGNVALEYGKARELGDISSALKAYDGPAPRIPQIVSCTKLTVGLNELSGICLGEGEEFLWAVGDDGDLAKISFEGEVLYKFHISGDTEDVSRNPETGDLLIGLEPNGVGIVRGPDFNTKASTLFTVAECNNYGNSGIEGLTYYKDGMVYAGAQSNSHLFRCDLKSGQVLWQKKMYDKKKVSEIAGLCYDAEKDWLWIIDSENKKVFVYTGDAESLIGAYPIDGSNPESVCLDRKHGRLWVGDDYGETSYLYRYELSGLE